MKRTILSILVAVRRTRWLPAAVRYYALAFGLRLVPVAGAEGQNGAIVVLKVNTLGTGGEGFVLIGGQGNLSVSESTSEIDVSDKLSGRLGERVAGRAAAQISVDLNFNRTDEGQSYLKDKYRARELVEFLVFDRDTPDTLAGTDVEKATGLITSLDEEHPDQDRSTMSLEISMNNDWEAA